MSPYILYHAFTWVYTLYNNYISLHTWVYMLFITPVQYMLYIFTWVLYEPSVCSKWEPEKHSDVHDLCPEDSVRHCGSLSEPQVWTHWEAVGENFQDEAVSVESPPYRAITSLPSVCVCLRMRSLVLSMTSLFGVSSPGLLSSPGGMLVVVGLSGTC